MAEWRIPVFDRTMDDVKSVDRTSAEYQKGALNADDLNRIEGNFAYLEEKLRGDAIFIPHRLRNYTETVMEYAEKESSILPDEYTQLEYLKSSGTQYINSNFYPSGNALRVVIKFKYTTSHDGLSLFGNSTSSQFAMTVYGSKPVFYVGTSSAVSCGPQTSLDKVYTLDATASNGTLTAIWNGDKYTASYSGSLRTDRPIYIFGSNSGSAIAETDSGYALYGISIYDNGTLVRDFVPCTNASGTAGLYDLVEGKFYANAGSGTFAAGMEVEAEPVYELVETKTTYTDWQENNLPWLSEINRIRANYNALVRLFLVGLGLPVLVESNYLDYTEVNNWERIAGIGKTMFENMEKEYRYCGMEESGGDWLL